MQYSNWNISFPYDQLGNNKIIRSTNGYNKIAQQIPKCEKASAKHIWKYARLKILGLQSDHSKDCCIQILR